MVNNYLDGVTNEMLGAQCRKVIDSFVDDDGVSGDEVMLGVSIQGFLHVLFSMMKKDENSDGAVIHLADVEYDGERVGDVNIRVVVDYPDANDDFIGFDG